MCFDRIYALLMLLHFSCRIKTMTLEIKTTFRNAFGLYRKLIRTSHPSIAETRFFDDYSKTINLTSFIEGLLERSCDCGNFMEDMCKI